MDKDELERLCANIEIARNKVDGMQMRDYFHRQRLELTRAMLAASWSLRVAHYCLQLAMKELESNSQQGKSPDSTRGGGPGA